MGTSHALTAYANAGTYHYTQVCVNASGSSSTWQDQTFTITAAAENVTNNGANPAQHVSDGTMTAGSNVLSSNSATFQMSDGGQPVTVLGVAAAR